MKRYIIELQVRINGGNHTFYHHDIGKPEAADVMNVYSESITPDKEKAQIFFEEEEAEAVGKMFARSGYQSFKVIPIKLKF